ncbi:hypothetical protein [Endozoicomonas sp. ALC013]|uniref:hypothetical protein n=1 Tax=Endozoicomonas sp. ALC013 TaxID=3403076 RepID=UPI003BB807CE
MYRLTSSQLNPAPKGLSNIQGMPLAEPGATGQAFFRMVTEVEQPVTNHNMTDQSTSSDNQGHLNPKKKWLKYFAVQNQTSYKDSPAIPVATPINLIEPLKNYQTAEYDPENNTFSIYSLTKGVQSTSQNSTDVDTKLNPPTQIPNQDGIGNFSKSTASIAIITPRLKSENLQQYTSPSIQAEEAIDENSSHIECQRELHKDPAYAQSKRERQRERRRERQRKRYQTDPAYAQRQRERQRKRYQTDHVYAERQRERLRELRKDPAYAQREKERQRERQRERRKQYRQSVNSAKKSGDLPLTSNSAEATHSSNKNLEGAAPRFSVVKLKEYLQSRLTPFSLRERSAIEG